MGYITVLIGWKTISSLQLVFGNLIDHVPASMYQFKFNNRSSRSSCRKVHIDYKNIKFSVTSFWSPYCQIKTKLHIFRFEQILDKFSPVTF